MAAARRAPHTNIHSNSARVDPISALVHADAAPFYATHSDATRSGAADVDVSFGASCGNRARAGALRVRSGRVATGVDASVGATTGCANAVGATTG